MTDQVGVRFGIGNAVLFVVADVLVVGGATGPYGVALLVAATALLAVALDQPHATALGLAGWAFATGFVVHRLGVLTFTSPDLLRLTVFVLAASVSSSLRPAPDQRPSGLEEHNGR